VKDEVLAVNILITTYPGINIIVKSLIERNKDIYKGVFSPPKQKRIWDHYFVFEGPKARIESLEFIFRKLFEKCNLHAKWLVQRRKTLKGWRRVGSE